MITDTYWPNLGEQQQYGDVLIEAKSEVSYGEFRAIYLDVTNTADGVRSCCCCCCCWVDVLVNNALLCRANWRSHIFNI